MKRKNKNYSIPREVNINDIYFINHPSILTTIIESGSMVFNG